ncbi:hypothetical protein BU23DRAFT_643344 [Bimuria novae-zelandiae CBS 107.79]|uniref:ubiquitinyl hydrolase 1 n=1 Tax=Bimuria novae-zelandiae CBS 107.79 TaxID=1447943 RepID=A0A6A5V5E5_9PLEO|nr:hypothetical protein BU23DRAFT_643344 [Bimuria novae-zelandiae CBS 107.79]
MAAPPTPLQLYQHVALPRDVPGAEDANLHDIEDALHNRLIHALKAVTPSILDQHLCAVDTVRASLVASKAINVQGCVVKDVLIKELNSLTEEQALVIYITKQNAALIVYKAVGPEDQDSLLVFEAFEASPVSEEVLASASALRWNFPGRAVCIASKVYSASSFEECLATFIQQGSVESVDQFAAVTHKAATSLPEIRHTSDPALVTGLLMTILEANGAKHGVPLLQKRVRDTVSFYNARKPWRRSALYLVLRVAIQRHLYRLVGPNHGRLYYKTVMALFICRLLRDYHQLLPHDASHFLMQKLGRRLAKLKQEKPDDNSHVRMAHERMFAVFGEVFQVSISKTMHFLKSSWVAYRESNLRPIRCLPQNAVAAEFHLSLHCSWDELCRAVSSDSYLLHDQKLSASQLLRQYEASGTRSKPCAVVIDRFVHLAQIIEKKITPLKLAAFESSPWDVQSCSLAHVIAVYTSTVSSAFGEYPELKSKYILDVMELWMAMDRSTITGIPLLKSYHPGFDPNVLDCLELLQVDDMKRVQRIQGYLGRRCRESDGFGSKTIFDPPAKDSFAVVYYDASYDSEGLKPLRTRIETEATKAREDNIQDWKKKSHKHAQLEQQFLEEMCTKTTVWGSDGRPQVRHPWCKKCKIFKEMKENKIGTFEWPLQADENAAKAAVFELKCPKAFAAYRDATWLILANFGYSPIEHRGKVFLLRDYRGVTKHVQFMKDQNTRVTLGSSTKSAYDSHYGDWEFWVSLNAVNPPCGLNLQYFDTVSKSFTQEYGRPSLFKHFPLMLPAYSPYRCLRIDHAKWPSSNEIIASQTRCPAGLNTHEFTTWQGLLTLTHCRWMSLLRELGATNLNFSTESTWAVVTKLVYQMGPASTGHNLRDIHAVFEDRMFCEKLLEQVRYRLGAIQRNWRESLQMDTLVTIIHKVISLSSCSTIRANALKLLERARDATWVWCVALRSLASSSSSEATLSIIWASVLCKRTVQVSSEAPQHWDDISRQCFVKASIVLHENLVGRFEELPLALRNLIMNDMWFMFWNRNKLKNIFSEDHQNLLAAVAFFWSLPKDHVNRLPKIEVLLDKWWVQVSFATHEGPFGHSFHYNLIFGDLLIDGEPSGFLPTKYHSSVIQTMFGTQALRVRPSNQRGMALSIDHSTPSGYRIHLGFRNGQVVVRAARDGVVWELIDRTVFVQGVKHDLPQALVENCYHWLDLNAKILDIRQDDIWKPKKSNWKLNLLSRQATRKVAKKIYRLVDPCSALAQNIASNFMYFEFPPQIMIFQPSVVGVVEEMEPLCIELRRLELSFFVNSSQLLQCRQLKAEIVGRKFQDAGVWYGLKSKILLRSVRNTRQRMLLVPEGDFQVCRDHHHVGIVVYNKGAYLKYDINDVLGRIECPSEPRLLYTMALWYAYTSFILPDPLTERVGCEVALSLLRSGGYKPSTPLPDEASAILFKIAKLTPHRSYYPKDLKCMEKVEWNQNFTLTVQDDRYRSAVQDLCELSDQLRLFETNLLTQSSPSYIPGDSHLETRAIARAYHSKSNFDHEYNPRDRDVYNKKNDTATTIAKQLADWTISIKNTGHLAKRLQEFPFIGGNDECFNYVQISDLVSVDLGIKWGTIVRKAAQSKVEDRFSLMFVLAPIAWSQHTSIDLIQVLASYAVLSKIRDIEHPSWPCYVRFTQEETPTSKILEDLMQIAHVAFQPPEYFCQEELVKGDRGTLGLKRLAHEAAVKESGKRLADSVKAQWPHMHIDESKLAIIDPTLLDKTLALESVQQEWTRLAQNFQFSQYIEKVQSVLNDHNDTIALTQNERPLCHTHAFPEPYPMPSSGRLPTVRDILRKSIVLKTGTSSPERAKTGHTMNQQSKLQQMPTDAATMYQNRDDIAELLVSNKCPAHLVELSGIVDSLLDTDSLIQREYGNELKQSLHALMQRVGQSSITIPVMDRTTLGEKILSAMRSTRAMFCDLTEALESGDNCIRWLKLAGVWTSTGKIALLSELRSTSGTVWGQGTKEAVVEYGVRITHLQRLLRMEDALRKNKKQQLEDERMNQGHENWDPVARPDWLLLEIDGDIMIRPEQVEVANATISPSSGGNSVVQLLMGRGKTSCIILLADKQSLMRILIPRSLLLQSAQVMKIKLGGLVGREVLHIPFSRRTQTDGRLFKSYRQLHKDLRNRGGVLLALPENILSFKLSGLQRLCDERLQDGTFMVKMQHWLDRNARDVLDECDVSLAIRTQLIYPSGSQIMVDGHPLRWQTIQAILRLLRSYLPELQFRFPRSIEVIQRAYGGFPLVHFLRCDVEDHLVSRIVDDVCKGQLPSLPCAEIPAPSQADIRTFISEQTMNSRVMLNVYGMFKDKQHLLKLLYLLRGLFVHRILLSTLKKLWNVQFGLHPQRDPVAVPYLAKGVPKPTSEWGHPDVAIILTCLSFYYQGIDLTQFRQAFEQLSKSDEPSIEYDKWMTIDLPESLRDYNSINIEDNLQLLELHQHVRFNVYVLDFYMNNFVFPRHAKQFDTKLQASGWDLVHCNPITGQSCKTTGFSGTNDSRHQLPMTIKQNDLPNLRHTNAEVLAYLLEHRNRRYICMVDNSGKRLDEDNILRKLRKPAYRFSEKERIRILIDAGAQILEYSNHDLVKAWLNVDEDAAAGVFFDASHRPWVTYRNGKCVSLLASPFAENLEDCVVYMDESHCRGTDLKLPPNARAALTLGPHVTKDALAQAAMRLRLLGQSQAVTFFSPPEVHQSILDLRNKNELDRLDSADVIAWLLQQSCKGIEQLEPLYINQGLTFVRQEQAKLHSPAFLTNVHQRSQLLSVMQTKESQTLEQMYAPKRGNADSRYYEGQLRDINIELNRRKENFQDRKIAVHSSALEEVEQERELEHEVENVRDLEKPIHFTALRTRLLHEDIMAFAKSGKILTSSEAYQPMFSALQRTATGRKHGPFSITSGKYSGLFVSTQFTRTVKLVEPNDTFLRPCQWILLSSSTSTALVVSPEEADALLPLLRARNQPTCATTRQTHLIVYSAPVTRRTLQFNNLDYYATPPLPQNFKVPLWLKVELGIFAGRLYFEWEEHQELLTYLDVKSSAETNGDVDGLSREAFVKKPLTFLHEWLAVLRKGQDFEQTPIGFITTGKPLLADHPFFSKQGTEESDAEAAPELPMNGGMEEDQDSSEDEDEDDEHDYSHEDEVDPDGEHENEDHFDGEDQDDDVFVDAQDYFEGNGKKHENGDRDEGA